MEEARACLAKVAAGALARKRACKAIVYDFAVWGEVRDMEGKNITSMKVNWKHQQLINMAIAGR